MNELALFAGAGGGILGGTLLGWRCVCAVECDAYAASVLLARQNDGWLEPFPIWDDVRTFDGRAWHGIVDVVSGGFPCQDISAAGKGAGIDGAKSGLWREMARIIGEVRPRYVWVENSPLLVRRGLARVLGDLAALGYDARWGVVGAHHAGAPHKRDRIWVLADDQLVRSGRRPSSRPASGRTSTETEGQSGDVPNSARPKACRRHGEIGPGEQNSAERFGNSGQDVPNANRARLPQPGESGDAPGESGPLRAAALRGDWWSVEPGLGRVADGLADRLDQHGLASGDQVPRVARGVRNRVSRLRCIGNGQVPAAMILAWEELTKT